MSEPNSILANSEQISLESLIAVNTEQILVSAQIKLNNNSFEAAIKMLLEAKEELEKDIQTLKSNLLLEELKDRIMNLVSKAYFDFEKFDDCFRNDKEVFLELITFNLIL